MDVGSEPGPGARSERRLHLQHPGTCERCGAELAPGTDAYHDSKRKTVRCVYCPTQPAATDSIDRGVAGGSARREFQRRAADREARVKRRFGIRLGGAIVAVTNEPQTTRAWGDGARGEELLGQLLDDVPGVVVLHDRRMPRTRSNIDHIVIGPGGVFVVDAKRYAGQIGIHNKGSFFHADYRLYVGRRDCSALAEKVVWQAKVVREAFEATGTRAIPPITPVLCFVDGDWPLINPPTTFGSVRLESERSIKRLVGHAGAVDPRTIEWATRVLAGALPAK